MIPILYDKTETSFTSNGLGRLRDCISCVVTEERNGIYECDFEYPITGAHYDEIQVGRIIGATHDESGDIQPFDIVSYAKPIDGIVTFHCTHISYRQCYIVTIPALGAGSINSLAEAIHMITTWVNPQNPFTYWTDKTSAGRLGCATGIPYSVRAVLGGIEGSILDAYGGEYEWDKWTVKLWSARGQARDFTIRYGVNMLDYNEEFDIQGTYSSCQPYWTDGMQIALAPRVLSTGQTVTGREQCAPLDLSDQFDEFPDTGQLQAAAQAYMAANNPFLPTQNIHVEFARLQDMGEFENYQNLLECNLCDTITVVFPDYNGSAQYKIVKTTWDVLRDRYESMELGDLSVTLSEALGVTQGTERSSGVTDFVVEQGTSGIWAYRKWNSGIAECWTLTNAGSIAMTTAEGSAYYAPLSTYNYPSSLFTGYPSVTCSTEMGGALGGFTLSANSATRLQGYWWATRSVTKSCYFYAHAIGRWK